MDVTLPNGTVIRGVPDGIGKWEVADRAITAGLAKPEDFGLGSAPAPTANAPRPTAPLTARALAAFLPGGPVALETMQRAYDRFGPAPEGGRRATIGGDLRDFAAGMGKYPTDIALGARQIFGSGTTAEATTKRELDAPLMRTGPGRSGNLAGGVVTTLPAAFIPGVNTVVGSAALGGVIGALQPTEQGGQRLVNTAAGAALGGATQYAAGRLFGAPTAPRSSAPSIAEIKIAKDAAYAAAEASDQIIPMSDLAAATSKVESLLTHEGYRPGLHPATSEALSALYEDSTRPGVVGSTLKGVEGLRRQLVQSEMAATNRADGRLAGMVLDEFDDAMEPLTARYGPARALYTQLRKAQDIEALFERAQNAAGGYTQSGYENSLRIQFRQLADNARRFNRFNAAEKESILNVVRGGPLQSFARFLGKFAARGPVSSMATGLLGNALGGPGGAVALGALGEGSRAVAGSMRQEAANRVSEVIRAGATIPRPPALPVPPAQWWNAPVGPGLIPQNVLAPSAAALGTAELTRRNALMAPQQNALYGRAR